MSNPHKLNIAFAVTNDLSYDQRMDRICSALTDAGHNCTLIGRKTKHSRELSSRLYKTDRFSLLFQKGKLFYLEYNFRLLVHLLFSKFDVYCAIDLDTFLPMYAIAHIKGKKVIYDAHEYFSELEEVVSRPIIHFLWQKVEAFAMKKANVCYTISEGYANLFSERYHRKFEVIRNVPYLSESRNHNNTEDFIIYQGALNMGRGLEQSILSMHEIEGLTLKIFGDGPIKPELTALIKKEKLERKVLLMGAFLPEDLKEESKKAFVGLTLFSETGLHHQNSLANRFFDYIHASIPQVAMDYVEYRQFNDAYQIALLIEDLSPSNISKAINTLKNDIALSDSLRMNCLRAREDNNWQKESKKLIEIYKNL